MTWVNSLSHPLWCQTKKVRIRPNTAPRYKRHATPAKLLYTLRSRTKSHQKPLEELNHNHAQKSSSDNISTTKMQKTRITLSRMRLEQSLKPRTCNLSSNYLRNKVHKAKNLTSSWPTNSFNSSRQSSRSISPHSTWTSYWTNKETL